ncbi:hypothetical protein ACQ7DA_07715 [Zafaria sp. J156]|uniref:hypothetical protein n=1 Tax=Zafaria sp. J156 TaxID=3116490 RepID=UPI002E75A943|nr:hypothetical protein [Zafaria sp. J156]MEE1620742.1 hypothetical protein [Zafaria sp. J156]
MTESTSTSVVRPRAFLHEVRYERPAKGRVAAGPALRDLTFLVAPGEAVGVLGTRKDGADDVVDLVCGSTAPDRGTVYVEESVATVTRATAFTLDESLQFNMERVAMGYGINGAALKSTVRLVGEEAEAAEDLPRLVADCEELVIERVRLCLALATGAPLLLLDEPAAQGRALTSDDAAERLGRYLRQGGSMLVVSKSPRLLSQLTERSLWLHEGEVLAEGPSATVARRFRQHAQAVKDGDRNLARQLLRRFRRQHKPARYLLQEGGRRRA